jgi:hypothetical protein
MSNNNAPIQRKHRQLAVANVYSWDGIHGTAQSGDGTVYRVERIARHWQEVKDVHSHVQSKCSREDGARREVFFPVKGRQKMRTFIQRYGWLFIALVCLSVLVLTVVEIGTLAHPVETA